MIVLGFIIFSITADKQFFSKAPYCFSGFIQTKVQVEITSQIKPEISEVGSGVVLGNREKIIID